MSLEDLNLNPAEAPKEKEPITLKVPGGTTGVIFFKRLGKDSGLVSEIHFYNETYGSKVLKGIEKVPFETGGIISKFKKMIDRPDTYLHQITEPVIPKKDDNHPFAEAYFELERLADEGVLEHVDYDMDYRRNGFGWRLKQKMSEEEFINLLRGRGIKVSL